MNVNMVTIAAILITVTCSFAFLADMILANWRALGKTKGPTTFGKSNKRPLNPHPKRSLDCFRTCMKKFAWDVDETSLCASECRS